MTPQNIKKLITAAEQAAAAKARAEVYDTLIKQQERNIKYGLGEPLPDSVTTGWLSERSKALAEHATAAKEAHRANTALETEELARQAGAANPSLVAGIIAEQMKVETGSDGTMKTTIVDESGAPAINPKTGKPYTPHEYVAKLKSDPETGFLFGNGQTSQNTGNAINPWKKETFNLTMQGKIARDNPALAERLKREAA